MAVNESGFKKEFKESLEREYGNSIALWTNNDMFRCGLPDFCVHYDGSLFAIEAKFVKEPPARPTSKVLNHELTLGQADFLKRIEATGGHGVVLIGFSDIAVAVPYWQWTDNHEVPYTNITLERVRVLSGRNLSFPKKNGKWSVSGFLTRISECVPPSVPFR